MTPMMAKTMRKISQLEAITEYLENSNRLWVQGLISNEELALRLQVVDEMQDVWQKADAEEASDPGSEMDQAAGYMHGGEIDG